MPYRDDLHAARQRIEELEEQVAAHEEAAAQPDARAMLAEGRILALQGQVERLQEGPSTAERLAVAIMPIAAVLLPFALACALVAFGRPAEAWALANVAVGLGVFNGSAWSWGRAGLLWPWALIVVAKLALLGFWASGWWWPAYDSLNLAAESAFTTASASTVFFWGAPPLLALLGLFEGLLANTLAKRRLRRAGSMLRLKR